MSRRAATPSTDELRARTPVALGEPGSVQRQQRSASSLNYSQAERKINKETTTAVIQRFGPSNIPVPFHYVAPHVNPSLKMATRYDRPEDYGLVSRDYRKKAGLHKLAPGARMPITGTGKSLSSMLPVAGTSGVGIIGSNIHCEGNPHDHSVGGDITVRREMTSFATLLAKHHNIEHQMQETLEAPQQFVVSSANTTLDVSAPIGELGIFADAEEVELSAIHPTQATLDATQGLAPPPEKESFGGGIQAGNPSVDVRGAPLGSVNTTVDVSPTRHRKHPQTPHFVSGAPNSGVGTVEMSAVNLRVLRPPPLDSVTGERRDERVRSAAIEKWVDRTLEEDEYTARAKRNASLSPGGRGVRSAGTYGQQSAVSDGVSRAISATDFNVWVLDTEGNRAAAEAPYVDRRKSPLEDEEAVLLSLKEQGLGGFDERTRSQLRKSIAHSRNQSITENNISSNPNELAELGQPLPQFGVQHAAIGKQGGTVYDAVKLQEVEDPFADVEEASWKSAVGITTPPTEPERASAEGSRKSISSFEVMTAGSVAASFDKKGIIVSEAPADTPAPADNPVTTTTTGPPGTGVSGFRQRLSKLSVLEYDRETLQYLHVVPNDETLLGMQEYHHRFMRSVRTLEGKTHGQGGGTPPAQQSVPTGGLGRNSIVSESDATKTPHAHGSGGNLLRTNTSSLQFFKGRRRSSVQSTLTADPFENNPTAQSRSIKSPLKSPRLSGTKDVNAAALLHRGSHTPLDEDGEDPVPPTGLMLRGDRRQSLNPPRRGSRGPSRGLPLTSPSAAMGDKVRPPSALKTPSNLHAGVGKGSLAPLSRPCEDPNTQTYQWNLAYQQLVDRIYLKRSVEEVVTSYIEVEKLREEFCARATAWVHDHLLGSLMSELCITSDGITFVMYAPTMEGIGELARGKRTLGSESEEESEEEEEEQEDPLVKGGGFEAFCSPSGEISDNSGTAATTSFDQDSQKGDSKKRAKRTGRVSSGAVGRFGRPSAQDPLKDDSFARGIKLFKNEIKSINAMQTYWEEAHDAVSFVADRLTPGGGAQAATQQHVRGRRPSQEVMMLNPTSVDGTRKRRRSMDERSSQHQLEEITKQQRMCFPLCCNVTYMGFSVMCTATLPRVVPPKDEPLHADPTAGAETGFIVPSLPSGPLKTVSTLCQMKMGMELGLTSAVHSRHQASSTAPTPVVAPQHGTSAFLTDSTGNEHSEGKKRHEIVPISESVQVALMAQPGGASPAYPGAADPTVDRLYLLSASGGLPPMSPTVGCPPGTRIRSEFSSLLSRLCADSFRESIPPALLQHREEYDLTLVRSMRRLCHRAVADLVDQLLDAEELLLGADLCDAFHRKGINLCFLGLVTDMVAEKLRCLNQQTYDQSNGEEAKKKAEAKRRQATQVVDALIAKRNKSMSPSAKSWARLRSSKLLKQAGSVSPEGGVKRAGSVSSQDDQPSPLLKRMNESSNSTDMEKQSPIGGILAGVGLTAAVSFDVQATTSTNDALAGSVISSPTGTLASPQQADENGKVWMDVPQIKAAPHQRELAKLKKLFTGLKEEMIVRSFRVKLREVLREEALRGANKEELRKAASALVKVFFGPESEAKTSAFWLQHIAPTARRKYKFHGSLYRSDASIRSALDRVGQLCGLEVGPPNTSQLKVQGTADQVLKLQGRCTRQCVVGSVVRIFPIVTNSVSVPPLPSLGKFTSGIEESSAKKLEKFITDTEKKRGKAHPSVMGAMLRHAEILRGIGEQCFPHSERALLRMLHRLTLQIVPDDIAIALTHYHLSALYHKEHRFYDVQVHIRKAIPLMMKAASPLSMKLVPLLRLQAAAARDDSMKELAITALEYCCEILSTELQERKDSAVVQHIKEEMKSEPVPISIVDSAPPSGASRAAAPKSPAAPSCNLLGIGTARTGGRSPNAQSLNVEGVVQGELQAQHHVPPYHSSLLCYMVASVEEQLAEVSDLLCSLYAGVDPEEYPPPVAECQTLHFMQFLHDLALQRLETQSPLAGSSALRRVSQIAEKLPSTTKNLSRLILISAKNAERTKTVSIPTTQD